MSVGANVTTVVLPRITCQFEISGKESPERLADMKLVERDCELYLAICLESKFKELLTSEPPKEEVAE